MQRVRENKIYSYQKAFTLAEVLIVLGIIGLIADMTIPTLHQKINDKITVTKLKKIHSTYENAMRLAINENGSPEEWGLTPLGDDNAGPVILLNSLLPYLNIIKNCGLDQGCFYSDYYKYINGGNWYIIDKASRSTKIILADGSNTAFESWSANCTYNAGSTPALSHVCGKLFTDVNGEKPPNVAGKDLFSFWITKYGIIPCGSQADTVHKFSEHCALYGEECSAWVVYNGNMDYLHCSGLSWDEKTSCK